MNINYSKDEVLFINIPRVTTFFYTELTFYASASTGKQIKIILRYSSWYNVQELRHSLLLQILSINFGVQLQDVFPLIFPCASHQPATFCKFPWKLLILFTAFSIFMIINACLLFVKKKFG